MFFFGVASTPTLHVTLVRASSWDHREGAVSDVGLLLPCLGRLACTRPLENRKQWRFDLRQASRDHSSNIAGAWCRQAVRAAR
jgi:hypothetical protein